MKKYITAKELAKELLKNPNDIICSVSNNFELSGAVVPQASLSLRRYDGKVVKEWFSDAFDGGSYSKEIVQRDEKGDIKFVQI